jgi:hypothetical protein
MLDESSQPTPHVPAPGTPAIAGYAQVRQRRTANGARDLSQKSQVPQKQQEAPFFWVAQASVIIFLIGICAAIVNGFYQTYLRWSLPNA